MKIIIISIGTLGDMEPFLAIGEILKEKGHHVICAFPEQFRDHADRSNLEFATLGTDFIDMLNSREGKMVLGGGGSGLKKMLAIIKLSRNSTKINKELVIKQSDLIAKEKPDRIVHNGKAMYPIIWGVDNAEKTIMISPLPYMHYVKHHSHVAFNSNYGCVLNKFTFLLANSGTIMTLMMCLKWINIKETITRKQIKRSYFSNKVIYTISPTLFSQPDYWGNNLKVLGYHQRKKKDNWYPDGELKKFIDTHEKIFFVTFGSMTNPKPDEKTRIFIDIFERNKIFAIINTASGGLVKPDNFDSKYIKFISKVPYDWIFPKVFAVIHHGGSGTCHLALKYGCACMIIPHIIDQFVWNKIVYKLGAGPKGIKIGKIKRENLEQKILALLNTSSFKFNAEEIAVQMQKEEFTQELYETIIE